MNDFKEGIYAYEAINGRAGDAVAILFAVGSALGAPRPARPESTQSPKHVLLIVPSDQGYSDIGYVDSTFYTPTLNQLAAAGIKLSNMHTFSTDTGRNYLVRGPMIWKETKQCAHSITLN